MKFAAIDIGSNAVRLLITNVYETEEGPVFYKDSLYRSPVRLGDEAFIDKCLSDVKKEDLIKSMIAFRNLMDVHHVLSYRACATAALRSLENGIEIIESIRKRADINLDIISGGEEANLILSNKVEEKIGDGHGNCLYIDVGGGSTELALICDGVLIAYQSFEIGTIRILKNMVDAKVWKLMRKWLEINANGLKNLVAIGSGGNINSIYKLYLEYTHKPAKDYLSKDGLDKIHEYLNQFSYDDRIKKLGLKPDRADVIIPAAEIFQYVLKTTSVKKIYIPKSGLSDGIIKDLYKKYRHRSIWEH
jgi:exopolyphosphatase/guanosine-5'-triphosphate,3'-diphosphate pyrophosphatase